MKIQGLQKLTLLDFPEKVACTVFTAGCNFRCPFCHNASLVVDIPSVGDVTEEEFFSFLKKRQGILDGVCVTGGEPLLQPGIEKFICKIKELGYAVKLDTNGSFPDKLKELVLKELVDYVAMDIKNCLDDYGVTIGVSDFDVSSIEESVRFLKEGQVKGYHSKESFEKIGQWISGTEKYFLQNFVDSGDLIVKGTQGYMEEEMQEFLQVVQKHVSNAELRGM